MKKRQSQTTDQQFLSCSSTYPNDPSSIFITDPYEHSDLFDLDTDTSDEHDDRERSSDNHSSAVDTNKLSPDIKCDTFLSSKIAIISSESPAIFNNHTLYRIGEEEDDNENHEHGNNTVFSKVDLIELRI